MADASGGGGRPLDSAKDLSDEGIPQNPAPRSVRWSLILVWFMRVVALLWITKGLASWAALLGIGPAPAPFEVRPTGYQATVIYFAVIDLVAAVGLWLTSTWGGVLWLLAIMSHLILAVFFSSLRHGRDRADRIVRRLHPGLPHDLLAGRKRGGVTSTINCDVQRIVRVNRRSFHDAFTSRSKYEIHPRI